MIPIYILHGLKSISHPNHTSVYTYPSPPTMGRGHRRNNGPHCLYRNLIYSTFIFNFVFFVSSMTTSWRILLLAFIGVKNITSWTKHHHWCTAIYKTYGNIKLTKNVHKGVISQVDNTNETMYNIKKSLCFIIFHKDQYFICFDEYYHTLDNAPMSFSFTRNQPRGANHNL